MPIRLNQAQLSIKDENGRYIGINTIAEKLTTQQITDIQNTANTKKAEMQAIKDAMQTSAQGYVNLMYSGSQPGFPQYYATVQELDEHIIEISSEQPASQANKLWIKNGNVNEFQLPTVDDLNNIIAPAYSDSETYNVGDYCIKDGYMYRCTTAISTAEAWTAAHWTQVTAGAELGDLKSAIDITSGAECIVMNSGYIITNTSSSIDKDTIISDTTVCHAVVSCVEGDIFTIKAKSASSGSMYHPYAFIDANGVRLTSGTRGFEYNDIIITAPANAAYAIIQSLISYGPYCIKGIAAGKKLGMVESSMRDTLVPYAFSNGVMNDGGTITGTSSNINAVHKYKIENGLEKIYITGESNMNASTSSGHYCVLWFVSGGSMMEGQYVAVTEKPQTWTNHEVTIPAGAEEIWVYKNISIATTQYYEYDIGRRIHEIDNRVETLEADDTKGYSPIVNFSNSTGLLLNDGTIRDNNKFVIKKYPYSGGDVYLDGTASYDIANGFCYVWYVASGAMTSYIGVSSKPQTFNMVKLDVPAGTEEIWVGNAALALYEMSAIEKADGLI